MFDFLKPDFLNTTAQQPTANRTTKFHSTLQDSGNTEALAQTVWRDLERLYKLPAGAIVCEVIPTLRHRMGSRVWVQLTVMHWSAPLALHMFALQNLFRIGLDGYEPDVDHSNITVIWQLDQYCGCPHTGVPDETDWAAL
jgi:hypothetical protein